MIDGSLGSNSRGVSQLRRPDAECVCPIGVLVRPASSERLQKAYWEQPYTMFWFTGLMSVSKLSPQP